MYLQFMKQLKPQWNVLAAGGPTCWKPKPHCIKGHFVGDPEMYRTREEVQQQFETNDP